MKLLIGILTILFLQSCINYTNLQSARTLGVSQDKIHSIITKLAVQMVGNTGGYEAEGGYFLPQYNFQKRIKSNLDWGLKLVLMLT